MNRNSIIALLITPVLLSACAHQDTGPRVVNHKAGKWYASCEMNHFLWDGPDRTKYQEAKSDATTHDGANHAGTEAAVVLQHPYNAGNHLGGSHPLKRGEKVRSGCIGLYGIGSCTDGWEWQLANNCGVCMKVTVRLENGEKVYTLQANEVITDCVKGRTWTIIAQKPCNQ